MERHRNALRLLKLVNTLLDFTRVEAGRAQAVYRPSDLSAITADLASTFRSACERAGLRLLVHCPALREPVFIDREMWEKIVLNLLSNAFKFTFAGEIEVSCRADGAYARGYSPGYRHGHSRARTAAHLRALSPRGQHKKPDARRDRHRPRAREGAREAARRRQ